MARHFAWIFVLALLAFASPAGASVCDQQRGDDPKKAPQQPAARSDEPPRWKWWLHPDSQKELKLTDQQIKKIDEIFESTMPKQRDRWHELERMDDALSKMIKENTADVATVSQQVDKVEKLRADLNTIRTVMIYKMHLVLTPDQRIKLDAIRARLDEERKKQEEERKRQGRGGDTR
jgi:Spy/CpxP family protein refolding chaperone